MIQIIVTIFLGVFLIFLVCFVVLLFISSVFHLKHMVPFVPTSREVIHTMIAEAELKPGMLVFDLGAGDGRVLRRAMLKVPGIRAIGYEGALGVWLLAKFLNVFSRAKPEMKMQNFFTQDLHEADVIFTYLSIHIMQRLLSKLEKELKPGARVITNTFSFKEKQPIKTVFVKMPFRGGTNVHVYKF